MRIGVGIGPFYASSSTRRGEFSALPVVILGLALIGAVFAYWKIVLPVAVTSALVGLWIWHGRRTKGQAAAGARAREDRERSVGWHMRESRWCYWAGGGWGADMPPAAEPHWQWETPLTRRWWDGSRFTGYTIPASSKRQKPPSGPEPEIEYPGPRWP